MNASHTWSSPNPKGIWSPFVLQPFCWSRYLSKGLNGNISADGIDVQNLLVMLCLWDELAHKVIRINGVKLQRSQLRYIIVCVRHNDGILQGDVNNSCSTWSNESANNNKGLVQLEILKTDMNEIGSRNNLTNSDGWKLIRPVQRTLYPSHMENSDAEFNSHTENFASRANC